MTGFGQGSVVCRHDQRQFKVEISTVNRKQLDIRINMPTEFTAMEAGVRKIIASSIHRGTVAVRVEASVPLQGNSRNLMLNRPLLTGLVEECRSVALELGISADISFAELLPLPGVIVENGFGVDCQGCRAALEQATAQAVKKLLIMREREGRMLAEELRKALIGLKELAERLTPATAQLPMINRDKLLARLQEAGLELPLDDERLTREIVMFADRYDVSEELARLQSHFSQFDKFLEHAAGPLGRSMEVGLQEIQREITTLGNKAASCDISPLVVSFKAELEKMREQVMNIE